MVTHRWFTPVFVSVAYALAASACSSSSAPSGSNNGSQQEAAPITLVQNPWDASRANVAIAQILMTEQMGLKVTVVEDAENTMWPKIVAGTYSACLEVWPSIHKDDVATWVTSGKVENGGLLGPVGKVSWYVPTYLLTALPQLATWEGFKDPATAQLFATPQTGSKGQFTNGDKTWGSYDAAIIQNLGLNLEEVWLGTEETELAYLDQVYNNRGHILMYLWTPHAALAKYDLTAVQLPPYSDTCYAQASSINCDYAADHLLKAFWPGLQSANPKAYQFLKNFQYTTQDQIQLLAKIDTDKLSVQDAARWWIDANQSRWQTWLPH